MEDKETQKRKRRLSKRERKRIQKARTTESNVTYSDGSIVVQESLLPTDYLDSYVPIPVPTVPSAIASSQKSNSTSKTEDLEDTQVDEGGCKSLGKWFPSAIVIKCSVCYTNTGLLITHGTNKVPETPIDTKKTPPKASLVLFYQYTTEVYPTLWSHHQLKLFITYLSTIAKERNLGGRMRVAPEGINATVSAVDLDSSSQSAAATLRHFAQDLKQFDPVLFGKTHFKFMDELSADRHFKECKILPVQELVYYGIREEDAPLSSNSGDLSVIATNVGGGGIHLEPQKYHEMLQKDNTVVIDVRNHYETVLGRFDGQTLKDVHGAEYVDPCMRKSTDFTSWLAKDETKELLQGKQVLMYCTGGIRCERASAFLKGQLGDSVQQVYQLKGGIENYLKTFPDGGHWRGKNFVFDKREAVSVDNPDGDGGVIRKKAKTSNDDDGLPSVCCICNIKWDRYVGKKKCFCCGVPVLMCDTCMSQKPEKSPDFQRKVRCPLCVAENISVAAKDLAFTANGVKAKVTPHQNVPTSADSTLHEQSSDAEPKAAPSVLKWGGGYSMKKGTKLLSQRPCKYGSNCRRSDCLFLHA